MTRSFRAIRSLSTRLTLFSGIALASLAFSSLPAFADDNLPTPVRQAATVWDDIAGDTAPGDSSATPDDSAPAAAQQAESPDAPSVETPLHHLYCVEYARLRSGLEIFGDAKFWWQRAENIYSRFTQPVSDAVMVFAGSARLARGHVAVVTRIVSSREIRVDQANWQNHGEIDHNTPVLDVSAQNDWSRVRVWDMRSNQFGIRVYPIKGFIGRADSRSQGV
jgi:surface antigen